MSSSVVVWSRGVFCGDAVDEGSGIRPAVCVFVCFIALQSQGDGAFKNKNKKY